MTPGHFQAGMFYLPGWLYKVNKQIQPLLYSGSLFIQPTPQNQQN